MSSRDQAKRKKREREKRAAKLREKMTPVQIAADRKARRTCGDCQVCCTVLSIPTLEKPRATVCVNQCAAGCAIYGQHPDECKGYHCLWRDGWGEAVDRPDRSGILFDIDSNPTFAKLAEARRAAFVIRAHLLDESIALSVEQQGHIEALVKAGEAVVLTYADHFMLYGPACVHGMRITREDAEAAVAIARKVVAEGP